MHRFFSGSRAHENAEVTGSPFSVSGEGGGVVGGRHVASVKRSTSFRMKYFGNVPPRLETLVSLAESMSIQGKGAYVASIVM